MKRSPFHQPRQVLIFNGAYVLIAITRSIRSASELCGGNPQTISLACKGRYIAAGRFYFRHVHPDIEIEMGDLDTLRIQEYDKMCNVERKYVSTREMARRKTIEQEHKSNPKSIKNDDEK